MFTIIDYKNLSGKGLIQGACKSTDTKPTIYANGSMCIEMDTGDLYMYDETSETWNKL